MATALSFPIDGETSTAARALREWFASPGIADICAGAGTIDAGTLERLSGAVDRLKESLDATKTRGVTRFVHGCLYTFDVINAAGEVVSAITIQSADEHRSSKLRPIAAGMLAEHRALYRDDYRLSAEPPRLTAVFPGFHFPHQA